MKFQDLLNKITKKNKSLVCVGLDSDIGKIPEHIRKGQYPQSTFNKAIIDATADLVCAYKPNSAFYEARGNAGIEALKITCDYIKNIHPEIPIILDAKRGDIGNTNEGYIKFAFEYLGCDAITLHPYLGRESLKPFLDQAEKGLFILCRTSNPGAREFQDLPIVRTQSAEAGVLEDKSLFQVIAEHIVKEWNINGNCGLVVGATYPDELKVVRHIAGNIPLLIPGIGAQGGDVEKTVKAGIDSTGQNAIINSSRGIIFTSSGPDFALKAREETLKLKELINKYRDY